jgi:hypothetical protein
VFWCLCCIVGPGSQTLIPTQDPNSLRASFLCHLGGLHLTPVHAITRSTFIDLNAFHRLITVQVLFFFFSRNDPARASAYFRIIEKEAEAAGTVVEPALAEMYLSHMLQLDDPTEALSTLRRLELKHSMQTNRSVLIDHPADRQEGSGAALSGGKLKVGALLYAKVVNVLLRANRTEDAEALIPVLEAKNLTRTYRTLNVV